LGEGGEGGAICAGVLPKRGGRPLTPYPEVKKREKEDISQRKKKGGGILTSERRRGGEKATLTNSSKGATGEKRKRTHQVFTREIFYVEGDRFLPNRESRLVEERKGH